MLKRLLMSATLVGSILAVPAAISLPASASIRASVSSASTSCYRRVGKHWVCITPGAFCPSLAHKRFGYAKMTNKKYRCMYKKKSDKHWRWRLVIVR